MQKSKIITLEETPMSLLRVYRDNDSQTFAETKDHQEIATILESSGIRFELWKADQSLSENATQEQILKAYEDSLDRIMKEIGFSTADVIAVNPQMQNHPELRKKFLDEHIHDEDEARFFVDGSGIFYIHKDAKVFCLLCEKGDFVDIPAGTTHWFDMGPSPFLKCIRTFNTPEGWVARFTSSDIASRYPRYEQIVSLTQV
jgi:1,2-dihydroxy-3-keto-5-methylthiopentene dioxygenase